MTRRFLILLALLCAAVPALPDVRPVAYHVVPFYTRTARLGALPVYPILAPTAGNLGVLAQVFGSGGGNPETLLTGLTDDTVLVDSGSAWVRKAIPNCVDTGGNHLNYTAATNAFSCGTSGAAAGANTALSNLAAVSINASLIPQTTLDLGAQTTPWRDLYLYGSGTYGTHSFRLTGTPTGHRVLTLPNVTDTLATLAGTENFSNKTLLASAGNIMTGAFMTAASGTSANVFLCFNGTANSCFRFATAQTPDTTLFSTSPASNTLVLVSDNNSSYDFAVGLQTNPTYVVTSANQSANERAGFRHNQTQPQVVDLANTAASARPVGLMGGSTVASAATITPTGNVFHVSGTTNIDTITIMAAGTRITLIFDGVLTVGDSTGNVKLSAGFTTSADDTLTLVSDGSSWFETGRSAN